MKRMLSLFSPRFVRSLVYILQSSEYRLTDVIRWTKRVTNFHRVELRKRLVLTPKAMVLLLIGYSVELAAISVGIFIIISRSTAIDRAIGIGVLLLAPMIAGTLLGISITLLAGLQTITERMIMSRTQQRLAAHRGIKIAIAGSYGKTSLREILRTVLSEKFKVAAPGGSVNTPLGISRFVKKLDGTEGVLIFELGEYYPGDVARLAKIIQPSYGFITGINEAHLEKFKTLEKTTRTIFEISSFVTSDHLYINAEDKRVTTAASPKMIHYSRSGAGEWIVTHCATSLNGTEITFSNSITSHSNLLGLHQVGPLSAAAQIASQLGLTKDEVSRGLQKTKPFDHRLQPSINSLGVIMLDDSYNGNPDGVRAVVNFLAELSGHRRWYITPGLVEMGDQMIEIHRQLGDQLATSNIEHVVLIRNSVTPYIAEGLSRSKFAGEIHWFTSGPDAYRALPQLTLPGDVVILQNDWPDQYA